MTMNTARMGTLICALAFLPALAACNRDAAEDEETVETTPPAATPADDAVRVTDVELGRSIGPDKKINDNADTDDFGRNDTIYAAVETSGNASGTPLVARWTFQDGQVVDESTQTVAAAGASVTEFHISKPDGWPVGKYKLEILLNGQVVETKDFEVK